MGLPWKVSPGAPTGTPQEETAVTRPIRISQMEAPDDELPRAPTTRASEARRVYIRRDVELARYGMTDGCQGCTAAHFGTTAMPHSEECRSRIMREMEIDKDDRLEAASKRMLDAAASAQEKPGKQARVGESSGGVRTSTGSGGGVRTQQTSLWKESRYRPHPSMARKLRWHPQPMKSLQPGEGSLMPSVSRWIAHPVKAISSTSSASKRTRPRKRKDQKLIGSKMKESAWRSLA